MNDIGFWDNNCTNHHAIICVMHETYVSYVSCMKHIIHRLTWNIYFMHCGMHEAVLPIYIYGCMCSTIFLPTFFACCVLWKHRCFFLYETWKLVACGMHNQSVAHGMRNFPKKNLFFYLQIRVASIEIPAIYALLSTKYLTSKLHYLKIPPL